MELQIAEAIELIKTLAETENLTQSQALSVFVAEAKLDVEYASQLKAALFEGYTLQEMASDSLTNALKSVFVEGVEDLQEVDTKETQEGTKYKVRVKDRASGSSYVRYATREKIAELRANPNISSVELTDHGTTGEDDRGEKTAAAKGGGKDHDGDGKVESSSKEHAGVVHNAIQRKMGGRPDGQDTRKEEVEIEEGMHRDAKTGEVVDKAEVGKTYYPNMPKKKSSVALRKEKEAAEKKTKKEATSWDAYLELREARAKTKEEASKKLEAHRAAMKDGGESPYFGKQKKAEGKDPWSTHPSDAKAHKKEDMGEGYKGKHGQSDEEYMDSRSDAGKQISGDSKHSGAAYSHRSFKGQGKPAKPGERQKAQGRMTQADRDELAIRKAELKKKGEEKKTQKEEVFLEADLVDAGRENQTQRTKKKLTGEDVDNSTNVKLMPRINEALATESGITKAENRLAKGSVNETVRSQIKELRADMKEECCPKCGTPECTCESKEEKPKKKKVKIDEAGMPILETKQESRNNARPGPSEEMKDPGADPLGEPGHMNPKGKPKRYKNKGEAPGDRRPNDPSGPDLPNEKGTVPNGAGV